MQQGCGSTQFGVCCGERLRTRSFSVRLHGSGQINTVTHFGIYSQRKLELRLALFGLAKFAQMVVV